MGVNEPLDYCNSLCCICTQIKAQPKLSVTAGTHL